ncbi:hypothetical protein EDB85DRAFT_2200847 [Lactarius pseudohatsudake]|nr:hypothetical protein EDB85DRAFT_2200847 [Lactarius pseudohatsudake]
MLNFYQLWSQLNPGELRTPPRGCPQYSLNSQSSPQFLARSKDLCGFPNFGGDTKSPVPNVSRAIIEASSDSLSKVRRNNLPFPDLLGAAFTPRATTSEVWRNNSPFPDLLGAAFTPRVCIVCRRQPPHLNTHQHLRATTSEAQQLAVPKLLGAAFTPRLILVLPSGLQSSVGSYSPSFPAFPRVSHSSAPLAIVEQRVPDHSEALYEVTSPAKACMTGSAASNLPELKDLKLHSEALTGSLGYHSGGQRGEVEAFCVGRPQGAIAIAFSAHSDCCQSSGLRPTQSVSDSLLTLSLHLFVLFVPSCDRFNQVSSRLATGPSYNLTTPRDLS